MVTEPKTAVLDELDGQEIEFIHTQNWDLPIFNLGDGKYTWRPGQACLPYHLFLGPAIGRRAHGISLEKDLIISAHGPRGACKTITLSFLSAKKLRMGQPVWGNWPVSFNVVERDCWDACSLNANGTTNAYCHRCRKGHKTYYENMPLDFDKLYSFNSEISKGTVAITEMQYYAEARTSGGKQNRFLSYQLMQIRKSALSFHYDVQNERWVDNRFRWSDDIELHCSDVSKMNYLGPDIEEGEIAHWRIRDISGILTGRQYDDSGIEYGPYQFTAWPFFHIFPTKWKVDVFEAVNSYKKHAEKNDERLDRDARFGEVMRQALDYFLEQGEKEVASGDIRRKATELAEDMPITALKVGQFLGTFGLQKRISKGTTLYDLTPIYNALNQGDNEN